MSNELTYGDLIVEALTRFPDREAFVHGDRRVTYRDAAAITSHLVELLRECGVGHGAGVALLSPNSPESWLVQAATNLLGARFTGLHLAGSVDDHIFICDDADIVVLVAAEALADRADAIRIASSVAHVVVIPAFGITCEPGPTTPPSLRPGPAAPEDVAWLMYTGGTTGLPKGVMVPHRAVVHQTLAHLASWAIPEQPRYLAAGPIAHASGLPIMPVLNRGGTVVVMTSFDVEEWLRTVECEQIDLAFLVPTMVYAILDHPRLDSFDLSSLHTVLYGAAPMSVSRLVAAITRLGPIFHQVYGQTEVIGVATMLRRDEHDLGRPERLGSCGRSVAGADVAVLDDEGRRVEMGEVGELCIRTRSAMLGYWNRPEETAEVLRDGWVRTGDMARQDDDGFFHLVDRKKDLIITGGFNVYSREVEGALARHPAVVDAAVFGIPDDKWGEAVCAVVVTSDASVSDAELMAFVRNLKGPIQTPKSIRFTDRLPTTILGKVDKRSLREPFWSGRSRAIH